MCSFRFLLVALALLCLDHAWCQRGLLRWALGSCALDAAPQAVVVAGSHGRAEHSVVLDWRVRLGFFCPFDARLTNRGISATLAETTASTETSDPVISSSASAPSVQVPDNFPSTTSSSLTTVNPATPHHLVPHLLHPPRLLLFCVLVPSLISPLLLLLLLLLLRAVH